MGKDKIVKRKFKTPEEWQAILEERFSYLPKEERDKLIYGNEFVKVPSEELARLRIDVYPYLM
ncbi:MAG: hypothetical protein Q4F50_10765 [Bacteroides sp.]|jgi:hypothetical protein|uniref:hypothetical protein n=1 Tax=Bacteroides sp. TaxID=29523 RepID=UPI0026E10D23|nr:hypothetical protein [Bacteroides sp.]MDO5420528.1 hypothetical protein [Bacteroides sp.]